MTDANELGTYLKARRANVTPEEVDLPRGGTRRVPGLRREEVASLAGLSVDYYTRLEQGREQHPSASVLNALARALRLEPDAQRYLFAIASPGLHVRRRTKVSESLLELIGEWPNHPVLITDDLYNVLGGNALGLAVYGGHEHSDNLARLIFVDPVGRTLYRDWSTVARSSVAGLRAAASHDPGNADLLALVGELTVRSKEFSKLWAKAEVKEKTGGVTRLNHPIVGDLDLIYETLRPNGSDLLVKVYRAEKGSDSSEKLALLGSLTAVEQAIEPDDVSSRKP